LLQVCATADKKNAKPANALIGTYCTAVTATAA
jgi:hypothetical protein